MPPAGMIVSAPFAETPPRGGAKLFEHVVAHRPVLEGAVEHRRPLDLHPVDRDEPARQAVGGNVLGDAPLEFRVDVDDRKARPHQARDKHRRFAQSQHRDVQQLAQGVQTRLEDVADQKGVVAVALGGEAVIEDFGGVEIFEIAVLVGDRAAFAEPAQFDAGAGRGGAGQDRRQPRCVVAAVERRVTPRL